MRQRGFTLVELLIAITIIGVLGAIGLNTYQGTQTAARDSVRKNDLSKLSTALELYLQKNGKYPLPQTGNEDCNRDTNNFYSEIKPYLTSDVPKDPKDKTSSYCYISINNGQSYRLFAKLEKCNDSSNPLCAETTYNYSITSEDLTLAAAPGGTTIVAGGSPGSSGPTPVPSLGPTVITTEASNVTGISATLNGTVNTKGSSSIAYFAYATSDITCANSGLTAVADSNLTNNEPVNITYNLVNLSSDTTYYFCAAAAEHSSGTKTFGERKNFKTPFIPPRRVFVTSTTYNGNLGGLTGADSKCQERANAASLGGSWKAWVSDNTTSAKSRLIHSDGPYVLVDRVTIVADNWNDLITPDPYYLDNAINKNESGLVETGGTYLVWTGTNQIGEYVGGCLNWTEGSSIALGRKGEKSSKTYTWTDTQYNSSCSYQFRLYCFEQ